MDLMLEDHNLDDQDVADGLLLRTMGRICGLHVSLLPSEGPKTSINILLLVDISLQFQPPYSIGVLCICLFLIVCSPFTYLERHQLC